MKVQNLVIYFKTGGAKILCNVEGVREVKDRIAFITSTGEEEFQMQDIDSFMDLEKAAGMMTLCSTLDELVQEMVDERVKESARKIFLMGMLAAYMGMYRS